MGLVCSFTGNAGTAQEHYECVCVCVCVCVDTHLHRDFFFYFDFTLSILSGYLEVFRQISIRINEKWDIT